MKAVAVILITLVPNLVPSIVLTAIQTDSTTGSKI